MFGVGALLSFIHRQIGLRTDAADPTGSLHAKVASVVSDVWAHSSRTLTQVQYPFWSAIITQVAGRVSMPATSTAYVYIQPPPGETWNIDITCVLPESAGGSEAEYADFDGITTRMHTLTLSAGDAGRVTPDLSLCRVLTNTLYARLRGKNSHPIDLPFVYGYSGFKLSQPLWSPNWLGSPPKPFKRPLGDRTVKFPQLERYAYLNPEERICYHLLSKVLAVNEDDFPVERLEIHVAEEDLVANLVKIKVDPAGTGWKEIFDKLAEEGIYL